MANFNLENYIPVNERLMLFYKDFPEGRVTTALIQHDIETGFVMFKAMVFRSPDNAEPSATGHAFEERAQGYVNKTSYIENCETSAVGRALALLGYEITKGIASREEMAKVQRHDANAASPKQPAKTQTENITPTTLMRIRKAEKAIQDLGGQVQAFNAANKGEAEQLEELTALSDQYRRLKEAKQ